MALLYFKTLPDPGAYDLLLLIPAIMILLIIFYHDLNQEYHDLFPGKS